jgi:hypothetical protein
MTSTATPFDRTAARARRFDGGMGAHGSDDDVIDARVRWVRTCERPEHFCPRCTAYKAACVPVCTACARGE